MSEADLFYTAAVGTLLGGALVGLLLGRVATDSPLVALALIGATAGGGAVLVHRFGWFSG